MTDEELRTYFGLSEPALFRLRCKPNFPKRDDLVNKTDRKAVDLFFDRRAGISCYDAGKNPTGIDGVENFDA